MYPPELTKRILEVMRLSYPPRQGSEGERKASTAAPLQPRSSVSRTLNEIGFRCSRTMESFRQTLSRVLEVSVLDETVIVDVLFCSLIPRTTALDSLTGETASQLLNSLLSGSQSSSAESQIEWWSIDVILTVFNEDCRNTNWTNVLRCLDRVASPYLPTEAEFLLFMKLLSRVINRPVPAAGLMSIWDNRLFQLSCIGHAANTPRTLIDFTELISPSSRLDAPEVPIPVPPNGSWLCVHLYSTLLAIASRGNNNEVMKLLADAAIQYPEYVFLGLAQTTDQNSGVRTELLRRLIRYFTGLNGSRPSSGAVMNRLYEVNQDLLVLILRISLKNSTTVQEIMNIDARLKNFGNSNGNNVLLFRIQEECTLDEILPYWCVIADYQRGAGSLHLEERLLSILVKNPSYARNIVLFAKAHIDTLRPRMSTEGSGGILSYENFVTILKCAQQYPTIVSTQDVRTLAGLANQRQQQQLQAAQQQIQSSRDGGASNPPSALGPQTATSAGAVRVGNQPQTSSAAPDAGGIVRPPMSGGAMEAPSSSSSVPASAPLPSSSGGSSEEIEEIANSYFQRIYTSNMTINDVIVLLKRFKTSTEPREQEIFRCMIHNLFDEYRFFHKYPDKELQLTGRLFGTLIQHQLVATITLGIALRYVLEALRKDPEQGGSNEKMFRFGKIALEQFRSRLGEWPQYCSHLVQIPHLSRHCADLYREAQRAISTSNPGPGSSGPGANPNVPVVAAPAPVVPPTSVQTSSPVPSGVPPIPLSSSTHSPSMSGLGDKSAIQNPPLVSPISSPVAPPEPSVPTAVVAPPAMSESSIGKQLSPVPAASNAFSAESVYESASQAQVRASATSSIEEQNPALESSPLSDSNSLGSSDIPEERRRKAIERMYAVNMEAPEVHIPSEAHRDQILFIINNIAKSNVEAKTKELKGILDVAHYNWFANYLIVKRISTQPNLHGTYIAVIDLMESSLLVKAIMLSGYHNVTKLLQSSKITNSSSERSLLRNLGIWLGQLTLSRNKPLLQRRCDLKELLLWGYEDGRLIAVCSFVAKILEGCKDSKIFRPPNPWLMSILGVMRELYEVEDLKMNIKFEVQVLCKNIGVKIEDIPRTHILSQCYAPIKEKNPDFNVRASNQPSLSSSPTPQSSSPQFVMSQGTPLQNPSSGHHGSGYGLMMPPAASDQSQADEIRSQLDLNVGASLSNLPSSDQIVIPNLASHVVVNSSLYYLLPGTNGAALLRRIVPLAVDKAILEIILPVVEKCVTMACVTTQHLVLKDFSQEPNETPLRRAAHQMISNLAGSLALVTCKEPLRVSISNHLRTLLSGTNMESSVIDQIVQKCSSDNLDLGCMLIEKAVTERAIRDIDEALAGPIKLRKKHIESGAAANTFSDTTSLGAANITNVITKAVSSGSKYPRDLPESMRALPGGLTASQLHVYDGFHRQKLTVSSPNGDSLASAQLSAASQGLSPAPHSMSPSPQPLQSNQPMPNPNLSMAQSLEAYQVSLARVDNSLKAVMIQAQGRDVSLSMLGGDHEIVSRLREIMHITQCTQPSVRIESALTFAESVFKRLVETVGVNDTLRLEVMVGILEALRDACGGSRKFIPDITGWLNAYATFSVSEEGSRKVLRDILTLLMRAKLLSAADVDLYFANNLDGGRNMLWVEMSLAFIRHSLAEGLAATYEYSKVFDIVAQMRPANPTVRKSLQKWLTDIRTLAAAREEQRSSSTPVPVVGAAGAVGGSSPSATPPLPSSNPLSGVSLPPVPPVRDHARDQVVGLLDQWLRVWQVSDDKIFARYLQLLHQHGVLKTEEAADKFFRLSVEICVEACLKSGQSSQSNQQATDTSVSASLAGAASTISYTVVDALSKLFLLLIRLADKEASDSSVRINLLGRILNAGARVLVEDHESKKANPTSAFDQRPYYRLFANLLQDLGVLDSKQQMQDPNQSFLLLLGAYSQIFLALQPSSVPGFAFSWLQLISHRCFMPHLLQGRGPIPRSSLPQGTPQPKITSGWPYMHRLLLVLLQFLQPFLRTAQLIDPIRRLYKGTLKVLLVLLHDFPEFLADYHLSLCEAIPPLCVQLRNLVLSAFPRSMRLPDPFTPNLKIDLLPEIGHSPRILTDFIGILNERGLRPRLDAYLTTKQPLDFPEQLVQALTVSSSPVGGGSLHPLLTVCVVMYAASYGINQLQQKVPITQGTPMDLWRHIVTSVDPESRYAFLNILGNQLRYPNSHTHYFSCVLLNLFAESAGIGGEIVQEQITRVLLERLIVHRPHPVSPVFSSILSLISPYLTLSLPPLSQWGLLVSFIELIKNPRYNFWSRPFVKCAPEIEKVFESVSRSCNGPSSSASSSAAISGGMNGGSVGGDDPK
jgi:CCR4-NOT transcription complex subunit 1